MIDYEAGAGQETDGYGRCLHSCRCPDHGRPRRLAQRLVDAIGSDGPEDAEETVERAVMLITHLLEVTRVKK